MRSMPFRNSVKYSNFEVVGEVDGTLFAQVDVTSWWRTRRLRIFQSMPTGGFRELESGEPLPFFEFENLYIAHRAKQLLKETA